MLEQGAIGNAGSEATEVLPQEGAGNIAAQRAPAMLLEVPLRLGRRSSAARLGLRQPVLETGANKLSFQAAATEQLIEGEELIAQETVVQVALDGRQSR